MIVLQNLTGPRIQFFYMYMIFCQVVRQRCKTAIGRRDFRQIAPRIMIEDRDLVVRRHHVVRTAHDLLVQPATRVEHQLGDHATGVESNFGRERIRPSTTGSFIELQLLPTCGAPARALCAGYRPLKINYLLNDPGRDSRSS